MDKTTGEYDIKPFSPCLRLPSWFIASAKASFWSLTDFQIGAAAASVRKITLAYCRQCRPPAHFGRCTDIADTGAVEAISPEALMRGF
jgi:hypothetical protein